MLYRINIPALTPLIVGTILVSVIIISNSLKSVKTKMQLEHFQLYKITFLQFLIIDGGWVYEGTLAAIKTVLLDYPCYMEDFYLFPKDFGWIIMHCDDGASMCRLWQLSLFK